MRGKLATIIDRVDHGHHVFRAYFKHAFLKQYEKFATYLRNELVSNNLADFHLRKGLDHLNAVRERFQTITNRFASFQALRSTSTLTSRCCNGSSPSPSPSAQSAIPASNFMIRASSACSKSSCTVAATSAGWSAKQIHQTVISTFHLSDKRYGINQLRYDLRKLKGHGLLQRDADPGYAYRLSSKGVQVALLFFFFH